MPLIRSIRIAANQGGRCGCQFQSPFTWQVYYVTLEHGTIFIRRWDKSEVAHEDGIVVTPGSLSACMINDHEVCVSLSGFVAGTDNSAVDTYVLAIKE